MISLDDPSEVPMDYVRFASIAFAYLSGLSDRRPHVLMIGLGAGMFTTLDVRQLSMLRSAGLAVVRATSIASTWEMEGTISGLLGEDSI
jgi:hypothetical protein